MIWTFCRDGLGNELFTLKYDGDDRICTVAELHSCFASTSTKTNYFKHDNEDNHQCSESLWLGILMRSQVLFLCVESWLCLILVVNTDKIRCQYLYSGSLWKLHTFGRLIPPSLLATSVTVKSSGYIKERFARDVRHTSRDCFFFTRVLNSWAMTALLKKRTWDNHKREYSGTIRLEHMMRQLYGLLGITEDGGMKVARSYWRETDQEPAPSSSIRRFHIDTGEVWRFKYLKIAAYRFAKPNRISQSNEQQKRCEQRTTLPVDNTWPPLTGIN